ncbi:hypothetical protein HUG10_07640 [Halorarum halophilum]|uniref:Uncharacterized protein n=1 Tax=Halorarum halophilum TaxID=2743090 RepID=A0A7D5GEJ7_9EURY|nr:hypothetical protein [Halobaculum halophilum]QLG27428.1 hypothetical protein HUG10_07640 [Halobaculum halophilum]
MKRIALLTALLIALSALLPTVTPAVASPQPDPVCGACGSSFEEIAENHGVAVNVTHSTATVQIHENGSATWIVTNRVNESAASRLSQNSDLLNRIAREAAAEGWGLPHVYEEGGVTFQTASIDDRTIRIQFQDSDAGTRHAGVLVVDYLHSEGVRGGWILNADRFTLHGPPGTDVVNNPRSAIIDEYTSADVAPEVTAGNATWRGAATHEYGAAFYDDVYIAYGGPETSSLRVDAALTIATGPIWLDNVQAFVLPAVVIYGLLLAGVTVGARWAADVSLDANRVAAVIAGIGLVTVLAAVLTTLQTGPSSFAGLGAIYLVTGGIALLRPRSLRSVRGALTVAVSSVLAVGVILLGLGLGTRPFEYVAPSVLRGMVFHLPLAVAPAFGLAVVRATEHGNRRSTVRAFVGALASLALAGMVFVPFDSRPWGLILFLTVGGAILAALLGLPLAVLAARRWANTQPGSEETGHAP